MHTNSQAKQARGTTLVEMAVIVAVLGLILSMLAGTVGATLAGGADVLLVTTASQEAGESTYAVARELLDGAQVIETAPQAIRLQVPIAVDGAYVNVYGEVNMGMDGNLDWSLAYKWRATAQISERENDADLNGDGDKTDVFDVGPVERLVLDATGAVQDARPVPGAANVLQPLVLQVGAAMVLGDDLPPLFEGIGDKGIAINMTTARRTTTGPNTREYRAVTARRVVTSR